MHQFKNVGWLWSAGLLLSLMGSASAQRKTPPPASTQKVDWGLFLPMGEGQFQTSINCTTCHSLEPIVRQKRTNESGWTSTVQTMAALNNANIQEDDASVISKYLSRSFTLLTPKLELPIHVNSADQQTLSLVAVFSDVDVQRILTARAKEPIKDIASLEKITGSDKLAKYKAYLSFDSPADHPK
jgi:DNA uptake protein ComE-like DNA-binding protein